MHSTNNLDDGYVGSGKRLWRSINKHGKENHKTEILEYLSDRKSLRKREEEIVNKELLNEVLCMNLTTGGRGSWEYANDGSKTHINRCKKGRKSCNKILEERWGENYQNVLMRKLWEGSRKRTPESRRQSASKALNTIIERYGHGFNLGVLHSDETKRKIGKANSIHQRGKGNSQYNTCWVSNLNTRECIKIKKEEMVSYIDTGWIATRILDWDKYIIKNTCGKCGSIKCEFPNICKTKQIQNLNKYFGFDVEVLGTIDFYKEYDRIVKLISDEYYINKLSIRGLAKKYNIQKHQNLDTMFKSLGIKRRTHKESHKLLRK